MSLDKSATNFFELITRLMEPREGGVAMTVTLGHVRLHGLIARSAHITLLFFGVSSWDADAPGLLRCSSASGSSGRFLAFSLGLQLRGFIIFCAQSILTTAPYKNTYQPWCII
jgi:hypothetical protein